MIDQLAVVAETQVGVREVGGNNLGRQIRAYQTASNLDPDAWPWCAAFVDWCILKWLEDSANYRWLALKTTTVERWRPTTALAFGLITWAKGKPSTVKILGDDVRPQRGDIVVFDFSHCGIVTGSTATRMRTVEGNTNGKGGRDSTSGDGVWAKDRALSLARAYIRIHPSTAKA